MLNRIGDEADLVHAFGGSAAQDELPPILLVRGSERQQSQPPPSGAQVTSVAGEGHRQRLHAEVLRRQVEDGCSYAEALAAVRESHAAPIGSPQRRALHACAIAYQKQHRCDYAAAVHACEGQVRR